MKFSHLICFSLGLAAFMSLLFAMILIPKSSREQFITQTKSIVKPEGQPPATQREEALWMNGYNRQALFEYQERTGLQPPVPGANSFFTKRWREKQGQK